MKISLIENGMDSLEKGYSYYLEYQKMIHSKTVNEKKRYLCLKDAIMSLHHGIEILFKSILINESEYLLFPKIDNNIHSAFIEKRNKNLLSVFQTSLKNKIRTVTYLESIKRVESICGKKIPNKLKNKIIEINTYRNILIHSEAYIDEDEIKDSLRNLIEPLDLYFYENFSDSYRSLSGYNELIKTYKSFKEIVNLSDDVNLKHKEKVLNTLINSLEENKILIGENRVKIVSDVDKIYNFISSFSKAGYKYGMDLYNGHCSGEARLKRIDKSRFILQAIDINTEYEFNLKSMLIYLPKVYNIYSPFIVLESDYYNINEEYISSIETDNYNRKFIKEIIINSEKIHGNEELKKFYDQLYDEENSFFPEYKTIFKLIEPGIIAFLNIQGLKYTKNFLWNIKNLNLKQVESEFRLALEK